MRSILENKKQTYKVGVCCCDPEYIWMMHSFIPGRWYMYWPKEHLPFNPCTDGGGGGGGGADDDDDPQDLNVFALQHSYASPQFGAVEFPGVADFASESSPFQVLLPPPGDLQLNSLSKTPKVSF